MDGKVFFPARDSFQPLMLFFVKVLFPIFTLTWRVNNYVSRQEKSISRRKENTKNTIVIAYTEIIFSHFVLFATFIFDSQQRFPP